MDMDIHMYMYAEIREIDPQVITRVQPSPPGTSPPAGPAELQRSERLLSNLLLLYLRPLSHVSAIVLHVCLCEN